jgi:hypothetical protein
LSFYTGVSIYIKNKTASPAALFGGSWSLISDKFLLGQSSSHPLGKTGGNYTVKLKVTDIPENTHGYQNQYVVTTDKTAPSTYIVTTSSGWGFFNWKAEPRDSRNSDQTPVDITPPFLAVNMWERIS